MRAMYVVIENMLSSRIKKNAHTVFADVMCLLQQVAALIAYAECGAAEISDFEIVIFKQICSFNPRP
jgi:hypothetical protein